MRRRAQLAQELDQQISPHRRVLVDRDPDSLERGGWKEAKVTLLVQLARCGIERGQVERVSRTEHASIVEGGLFRGFSILDLTRARDRRQNPSLVRLQHLTTGHIELDAIAVERDVTACN